MEYYALFQRYLKLYENTLLDYIESLDVSVEEFYSQVSLVLNDSEITDKKLLHFANYLVACTDYESFYKAMARAAKKQRRAESKTEGKESGTERRDGSKEGRERDSKSDYK